MKQWGSVLVLMSVSVPAFAADYRDCKELFVSPLEAVVPATKPGGAPWDEGSAADPELTAVPAERKDVLPAIIGPKLQDTASPRWNSLFVEPGQTGAWLPVRVGDTLKLRLIERDALSDDLMGQYTVEVPKELSSNGVAFATAGGGGAPPVFLRMAATDGKRTCAGFDGPVTLNYVLPSTGVVVAQVDAGLFASIQEYNRCSVNGKTTACQARSYSAIYADINKDGVPDVLVRGGPFDGGKAQVIAVALGFEPAKRKEIFVGACEEVGPAPGGDLGCTLGGKTTLVSIKGEGGAREASKRETEALSLNTAAQRAKEARINLKMLYTTQMAFRGEHDRYSDDAVTLGFDPVRGNRYAYFLAPRGAVQKRESAMLLRQASVSIIGPDVQQHPESVLPSGLKEAGCPLTFGTNQDGEPVGLGVSGQGTEQHFIAYAVGNVDGDAELDCWSVSDLERKAKDGTVIPKGEPFHERSDYDEKQVADSIP
ncbi:hypothetical protein D7Y27_10350 [Corallococcus sp. AB004]|nr:hypothetical protein D7Y27_10350 [Corallococcus sp. AB004]